MIRDPSDGSVREKPSAVGIPATKPIGPDTGLRQPTRTDAQLRLEASRAWLKTYHTRKAASHDGGSDGDRAAGELPDRAGG